MVGFDEVSLSLLPRRDVPDCRPLVVVYVSDEIARLGQCRTHLRLM